MNAIKTASGLTIAPIVSAPTVRILTPGAARNNITSRAIWTAHYNGSESRVGPGHTTPRRTIS